MTQPLLAHDLPLSGQNLKNRIVLKVNIILHENCENSEKSHNSHFSQGIFSKPE